VIECAFRILPLPSRRGLDRVPAHLLINRFGEDRTGTRVRQFHFSPCTEPSALFQKVTGSIITALYCDPLTSSAM